MAIPALRETLLWVGGGVLAVLILDALQGALWPFIAGMVIAYFLDPLADRLEAIGCPRGVAAGLIVLVFLSLATAVVVLLVPVLVHQLAELASRIPDYLDQLRAFLKPQLAELQYRLSPEMAERLREALRTGIGDVFGLVGDLAGRLLGSSLALVNLLSILVIMPLVAFYLLRDWDRMVERVDSLLPRRAVETVRTLAREIDERLSGFVRGQALVCLVLATWFSVGLSIVGLDFGLVVGIGAGLIAFIPYVSTIVGVGTALGLALAQFDSWPPILGVALVFGTGQILQDALLVPKLVGSRVGLHPAWVLFALMAGGTAFGFTGVLLAVPAAAAIGVITRYAVDRYRESDLFGDDSEAETSKPSSPDEEKAAP